jgi:holin-like protein
MLEALSVVLAFQLLGEALSFGLHLPVPGPVIGLVGLFISWPLLSRLHGRLDQWGHHVLSHLGLLFVPAGVGISLHLGLIAAWWAPLLLALVVSLAATVLVVVGAFGWLSRRERRQVTTP